MKKMNPKENRHKTPRITWFSISLYPRVTMNKFHYNKFGIIQIGVESLSQNQIPNTTKQLSHKYKPKRTTNQIQNLQQTKREEITKPQNQNQAVTNISLTISNCKSQISKNQTKESLFFSHPHSSKFATIYIGYSSRQRCKSFKQQNL